MFETIYPLYLKANIGRDAPDIILSKKPSSQIKGKSKQKSSLWFRAKKEIRQNLVLRFILLLHFSEYYGGIHW